MGESRIGGRASAWLSLAATPVFAGMAVLTATLGSGPADILCAATHGSFPLSGMVPMYLLMSLFHSQPWFRLFERQIGNPAR